MVCYATLGQFFKATYCENDKLEPPITITDSEMMLRIVQWLPKKEFE